MPRAPRSARPVRRNRTRQRARLLELLRATEAHPTAAWLHGRMLREFPRLSLGTVYRNLEVLVGEGAIDEVPVPGGPSRYDAKTAAHHHFTCEICGRIDDLELALPLDLGARVRRKYRLAPRRFRIDFYGLCRACTVESDRVRRGKAAPTGSARLRLAARAARLPST